MIKTWITSNIKWLIVSTILTVVIIINGFTVNNLYNKINILERDVIENRSMYFHEEQTEKANIYIVKQKKLDKITSDNNKTIKKINNEIKDTTINFSNDSLYNWINSEYSRLDFDL